jgi:hypothetical protein
MMPNQDQVLGAVRTLLAYICGYAMAQGWINNDQTTLITGVVASLAPLAWSIYVHSDSKKLAAVAALPDVKRIVTVINPVNNAVRQAASDTAQPKVAVDDPPNPPTASTRGPAPSPVPPPKVA